MKRTVLGCFLLLGFTAALFAQTAMSVEVRETQLRAAPSFLGRVERVLQYGDQVSALEQSQGWARVTFQGATGWVHGSALTTKRIVMQTGDTAAQRGATGSEVALAGRGFNKEVEEIYRSEQGLDFSHIDRMEGYTVEPERLAAFIEEGRLRLPGGGR